MSSKNLEHQIFSQSESVTSFLTDRVSRGRAKGTVENYRFELSLFFRWWGSSEIEKITPDILRKYYIELGTHRNKGGVHSSYRVVKCFLNFYWEENDIAIKNPIKKVKIQNNKISPLPEFPLEDIQKMLGVVSDRMRLRDTAILKCLTDSGARAQEFLDLNVEDVNLTTGTVLIRHGKGDKFRQTFFGNSARKALAEYLASRKNVTPDSPLWLNDTDERMKFYGLRMLIIRLCRRAGVAEKGVHSFRRTFALTLWRKGIDVLTISRLLGHTSIEVTKRYLNIGNEDLQKAHNLASPADCL